MEELYSAIQKEFEQREAAERSKHAAIQIWNTKRQFYLSPFQADEVDVKIMISFYGSVRYTFTSAGNILDEVAQLIHTGHFVTGKLMWMYF